MEKRGSIFWRYALSGLFVFCALGMVGMAAPDAMAEAHKTDFTLSVKNVTVLQNLPDREIVPQAEPLRHEPIFAESPTTGLPWVGEYLPMLVQIDNGVNIAKVKGREIKSAGIGKGAPWGIQYADVVYEELILRGGYTRFCMVFSDSLMNGQPKKGAGPVRSGRYSQLLLREEWQAGLVHGGGVGGRDQEGEKLLRETEADNQGVIFDLRKGDLGELAYRVQGVKAPSNYNADIARIRELIPEAYVSNPRPFLFADVSPYGSNYETAQTIHLDWGNKWGISHFQYDPSENTYLRYCGAGMNAVKWAPFLSYAAVDDRSEENMVQPAFANVIIQRVSYRYLDNNPLRPDIQSVGKGNAEIFIGGRYIPGYWVCPSVTAPTVFYDDQGNEIVLSRGKTFIAHFPPDSLCTFSQE